MEKNYLEAVETWDNFSLIVTHKVATSLQNPQWYEPKTVPPPFPAKPQLPFLSMQIMILIWKNKQPKWHHKKR